MVSALNKSVVRTCDGRMVSEVSLLYTLLECGYVQMESLIPYVSGIILAVNAFILCRQWPNKNYKEPTIQKCLVLIDPLVAAIICPLTSDLYFTSEWTSGCSTSNTLMIVSVTLVLYVCSLGVCYRLVELALPPVSDSDRSSASCHRTPSVTLLDHFGPTFAWSVGLNFALTWFILPLVAKLSGLKENFDSEICQPFFITDMMVYVFATSCATQTAYLVLYYCVCRYHLYKNRDDTEAKTVKTDARILILYLFTALLCLITTSLLRFVFMTCSCEGLFNLSRSFPMINFMLGLKLPFSVFIEHFFSRLYQRFFAQDP